MFPATNPPMAVFKLSSFSRRFAVAYLTNSYDPPIAAITCQIQVYTTALIFLLTKDCNRAARPGEDRPRSDILFS